MVQGNDPKLQWLQYRRMISHMYRSFGYIFFFSVLVKQTVLLLDLLLVVKVVHLLEKCSQVSLKRCCCGLVGRQPQAKHDGHGKKTC